MKIFYINTFTNKLFSGNPAAVVMLEKRLPDEMLQAIALENNLPSTAFVLQENEKFKIRWFTPEQELDLCGHATLAAAYVLFNKFHLELDEFNFHSESFVLHVKRDQNLIFLTLPRKNVELSPSIDLLTKIFGQSPKEVYIYKNERCLAIFETEEEIMELKPDINFLNQLPFRAVDVTSPGKVTDFVSRTFYPKKAILEDPVCGAAHCALVPYWEMQYKKTYFHAQQLSKRGGELFCRLENEAVIIGGQATIYMEGMISLNQSMIYPEQIVSEKI